LFAKDRYAAIGGTTENHLAAETADLDLALTIRNQNDGAVVQTGADPDRLQLDLCAGATTVNRIAKYTARETTFHWTPPVDRADTPHTVPEISSGFNVLPRSQTAMLIWHRRVTASDRFDIVWSTYSVENQTPQRSDASGSCLTFRYAAVAFRGTASKTRNPAHPIDSVRLAERLMGDGLKPLGVKPRSFT
jgi:hypothetical protein